MATNYNLRNNFLFAYVKQYAKAHSSFEPEQRDFLLAGLDAIIEMSEQNHHPKARKNSAFDNIEASNIRENARLTRTELAVKLGFSKYDRDRIQAYESGRVSPRNPPQAEFAVKYMRWLKRYGYNPYNL